MINFSFLTIASTLAFYIAMDVQDKRGGERERGGGGGSVDVKNVSNSSRYLLTSCGKGTINGKF